MFKIISSVIIFAAAAGVFLGVAIPGLQEIKKSNAERAELNIAMEKFNNLERKRTDLLAKFGSIAKEDSERIDKALPNSISSVELVSQIDDLAKKRGLLLKKIDIEEPSQKTKELSKKNGIAAGYNSVGVSLPVSGSYEIFLDFLADLERSLQIIDVKDISFSAGSKLNNYDFNLRATTYYYAGDK